MPLAMNLLRKFSALPRTERRALAEAVLLLGLARVALLLPFRIVAPSIGRATALHEAPRTALDPAEREAALAVGRALRRAANRVPWTSSCLVRAVAGRMMLRRLGLPSLLELGARPEGAARLAAHAWLRCGDIDVIGAETAAEYTSIAAFRA